MTRLENKFGLWTIYFHIISDFCFAKISKCPSIVKTKINLTLNIKNYEIFKFRKTSLT